MASELLSTKEIAERLHVTRAYVTDKLVKSAGFPSPAVSVSQRLRRWRADEVERFLKKARA